MAMLTRSLVLLCSLLLALPQGWCCLVGAAPCCNQQQPAEKQELPAKHKSCCCCQELTEHECSKPVPAPKPGKPLKACCCEKALTALPNVERQLPDLVALPLAVSVDVPLFHAVNRIESARRFAVSPFPLHVFHCVWLC
ncbi:MAG TPA: hypothetical protein VGZ47_22290 [Gemmataceae bacterium]|jgi:hypothetical protein|nr:hypothetical protein [Gemmataceae bacterium]